MHRRTLIATTFTGATLAGLVAVAAHHGLRHAGPPLAATERAALVENAIALMQQSYVFPDKAAQAAAALRAKLRDGGFDAASSAEAFADALTDALRDATGDAHLAARYVEAPVPATTSDADGSAADKSEEMLQQRRRNFGFAEVKRLHGNIGYLDIHQFGRPEGLAARVPGAMALLADTAALIVDLRHCGGGDPDSVKLVASYLVDGRTHLNDIYWRDEDRLEERWTRDDVPGQRYGGTRPLYILTSRDTFSGGEDFAYALRNAGRAILVGETTGGGAHPGNPRRLGEHFLMFVPSGRPINPVTHTDWEGVGVVPDIAIAADKALDAAQIAVLQQLIPVETDPEWKGRLEESLADLQ